jgi:hypothetical protein
MSENSLQRQLVKVQALSCTVLEGHRNVKRWFCNPGGLDITTRVTRRSETSAAPDRLDTSEYFQQVQAHAGTQQDPNWILLEAEYTA